jgi:long-chain acyl-CoA synthetase
MHLRSHQMRSPEHPSLKRHTTTTLLHWRASRSADLPAVRWHRADGWASITWREYAGLVARLARQLRDLGCGRGTRVALFADTCFEWALVDFAVQSLGGIVVAVHPSYASEQAAHALDVSGASMLFVGGRTATATLPAVIAAIRWPLRIYTFDRRPAVAGARAFHDLLPELSDPSAAAGAAAELPAAAVEDDLATIVFTSGTAGLPKAVCLTHKNIVATALASTRHLELTIDRPRSIHWLPFAHLFGRIGLYLDLAAGCEAGYARGVRGLATDLERLQPSFLFAVPKALRRFRTGILRRVERLPRWRRACFAATLAIASRAAAARDTRMAVPARALQAFLKRTIFRSIVRRLGARLQLIVVGSAAVEPQLCAFFEAFGIAVCEGYGMTETSGVAFVNPYGRRRPGTVGTAIETVQYAIAGDGELLLKGESICRGHLDPAHDRDAFTEDGWFRTGDLVEQTSDGHLSVRGRKKEVVVTDDGEEVAAERIEARLAADPLIKDAVVFGEERPYLVAVLNVDHSLAAPHSGGRPVGGRTLASVLVQIMDEVNRGAAVFERVQKFIIARQDFSIANGELTPAHKKRRQVILAHYRDEIDALYASR